MKTNPVARRAFTLVELLVVIAIIGILIGILMPAINVARSSARRSQCGNNLKQTSLALLSFHNARRHFPPTGMTLNSSTVNIASASSTTSAGAATTPIEGTGWVTAMLPYLDSQPIYNKYDPTQPWSAQAIASSAYTLPNVQTIASRMGVLECPMSPVAATHLDGDPSATPWTATAAPTDYGAITQVEAHLAAFMVNGATIIDGAGPGAMPLGQPQPSIDQIRDGVTNTILLAECAGRPQLYQRGLAIASAPTAMVNGGGWCRPASDFGLDGSSVDGTSLPGPCAINCTNGENVAGQSYPYPFYGINGSGEIYSFHNGGANIAFADGGVMFVRDNIDIRVIARLVTRSGDEIASRDTDLE